MGKIKKIEFTVYKNGNKIKSQHVTAPDNYKGCTNEEFARIIRENTDRDFWFNDKNNKKDITYERLLYLLKSLEVTHDTMQDVAFLNKIIRAGGFVEYVKTMEKKMEDIKFKRFESFIENRIRQFRKDIEEEAENLSPDLKFICFEQEFYACTTTGDVLKAVDNNCLTIGTKENNFRYDWKNGKLEKWK